MMFLKSGVTYLVFILLAVMSSWSAHGAIMRRVSLKNANAVNTNKRQHRLMGTGRNEERLMRAMRRNDKSLGKRTQIELSAKDSRVNSTRNTVQELVKPNARSVKELSQSDSSNVVADYSQPGGSPLLRNSSTPLKKGLEPHWDMLVDTDASAPSMHANQKWIYAFQTCASVKYVHQLESQLRTWASQLNKDRMLIIGGPHDNGEGKLACDEGPNGQNCKEATVLYRGASRAEEVGADWLFHVIDDAYVFLPRVWKAMEQFDPSEPRVFANFGCGRAWQFHPESNGGTKALPAGWIEPEYHCDQVWQKGGMCTASGYIVSSGALKRLRRNHTLASFVEHYTSLSKGRASDLSSTCLFYDRGISVGVFPETVMTADVNPGDDAETIAAKPQYGTVHVGGSGVDHAAVPRFMEQLHNAEARLVLEQKVQSGREPAGFAGANQTRERVMWRSPVSAPVLSPGDAARSSFKPILAPSVLMDDGLPLSLSLSSKSTLTYKACGDNATGLQVEEVESRPPTGQLAQRMKLCYGTLDGFSSVLETVKTKPRMWWALISGAAEHEGRNFQDRVLPSVDTWLKSKGVADEIIAVLANTPQTQTMLEPHCKYVRHNTSSRGGQDHVPCSSKTGAGLTALVTNCKSDGGHNGKEYADGPCCKYDRLLAEARSDVPDWIYIGDDDLHVDMEGLHQVLGGFDPEKPYILSADGSIMGTPDLHRWNKPLNECLHDAPQGFFYAVLSRGLVKKFLTSDTNLATICKQSGGAYDTTVGLWAWKEGAKFIPARELTTVTYRPGSEHGVIVHGVRSPEVFTQLHTSKSRKQFPDVRVAQSLSRDYLGAGDPCAPLLYANRSL